MRLVKLTLHKYTRMARARETLVYEPTLPIQLIIGSNGAGKSSLIFEMFPLASSKDDFGEGGYKEAVYHHEGKLYKAHSYFRNNKDMVHELSVQTEDGEWQNLNDGPTAKVHNENVEKIFNITPNDRQLLLSINKFSAMLPDKRRELFTRMSDVDFTFGLSLYQRIQKEVKTTAAVIKYLQESLLSETSNVISEDQVKQIQTTTMELHAELQKLYKVKTPFKAGFSGLPDRIRKNLNDTRSIVDRIMNIELAYPTQVSDPNPELIRQLLRSKEDELVWTKSRIDVVHRTYYDLKSKVGDINIAQGAYVAETQARVQKLEEEIASQRLLLTAADKVKDEDIETFVRNFEAVYSPLMEIFAKQPDNSEKFYSGAKLKELNARVEHQRQEYRERNIEANRLRSSITHLREHEQKPATECPRCKHQWRIGFDKALLEEQTALMEQVGKRIEQLEQEERETRQTIHEVDQYLQLYLQYLSIMRTNPALYPLWDVLQANNLAFENATLSVSTINSFYSDLPSLNKIASLLKELRSAKETIEQFQALDLKEIQKNQDQMREQETELSNYSITERSLVLEIRELSTYLKQVDELANLETQLAYNIDLADTLTEEVLEREHHHLIEEMIRNVQSSLSAKESILQAAQQARGNMADLEARLERAKLKERAAKLLISTLSPTEGLIAEGMTGFVNNYMTQVNKVIASIWSYDMFVLPVTVGETESADLTYRFPLQLYGMPKPLKDIVEGSLSMQQLFDMAFRVVGMAYLGLEHMPLFLDEFGTGFDEHHKNEALKAIRKIIEQMGFEQTFIISHDSNNYGGLSNAELCVLCDKNVLIPPDIPRIV